MSAAPSFAEPLTTLRLADDRAPARASIGSRRNPASHAAILDAAEQLLRDQGPAGVTMDAVARAARAGKPTVYRWWPDRLSLFAELHARATASIAAPPLFGTTLADDIRVLSATILHAWSTTILGPAVRAIVAEVQASDLARARADSEVWPTYREMIANLAERHGETIDVVATFESWLAAFLFRTDASSATTVTQHIKPRNRPVIERPAAPIIASVRDRSGWVD